MTVNSRIRKIITNYNNPDSWISRWRARRIEPLLATIEYVYGINGKVRVVDLGGRLDYWNIVGRDFLEKNNFRITLVNVPSVSCGPDDELFEHHIGDACKLEEFSDSAFDIVHSNSVLEHVGDWKRITRVASESRRLAPWHFVQTPYFWFPIEPHYVRFCYHWLPWPWRAPRRLRRRVAHPANTGPVDVSPVDRAMSSLFSEPFLLDIRTF